MREHTHSACMPRIEAEGEHTQCCFCRPHDDCELNPRVFNKVSIIRVSFPTIPTDEEATQSIKDRFGENR